MDSFFIQAVNKKEGEGVRIKLYKEKPEEEVTVSGYDFKIKFVDNDYDVYPEMHVSYENMKKMMEEVDHLIQEHHNLFKRERREIRKRKEENS